MERVKRIKTYIIGALAVAVFLIVAALSVSLAQWLDSPVASKAESGGKIGLFYVNAKNGDTVREVSGACNADNSFTYKNYVCVFRATDNVDYAFVNFTVQPKSGTGDVGVSAFTVSRAAADKTGVPVGGMSEMEILNPPSNLSDFAAGNAIFAPYVKLDFLPGEGQYFALEITIATSGDAEFVFSATVSDSDNHEWRVPNAYFLGFDGWKMNATSVMTGTENVVGTETCDDDVTRDIYEVDYATEVTLKNQTRFKMMKSDADTGAGVAVYFRPLSDSASLISDCAGVETNGDIRVQVTGVFSVRYYGEAHYFMSHSNGAVEYKINYIEVTLVRDLTETLTETDEPGSYIVGIFTDDKVVKEYELTEDYENIEGFKQFDWSARADVRKGDRFRVVTINADGSRTETEKAVVSLTSLGEKKMLFDEFENKAYGDDGVYRFIVNPNGVASTGMTIGYRRIITNLTTNTVSTPSDALATEDAAVLGYQFETGALKPVPNSAGRYYADIPYNETLAGKTSNLGVRIYGGVAGDIVSVTVHGTDVNSYNINKYSGVGGGFAGGYSYEITASDVPKATGSDSLTDADCVNWIGTIAKGRNGEGAAFSVDNGGYVVLDADGSKISDLSRDNSDLKHPFVASIKKTAFGSRRFVVFINGNAKALRNDDEIPRVTKVAHIPYAFSTVNSEKALGTYFIGASASLINISFLSQDVAGQSMDDRAPWLAEYAEGYYAVGQFSRWKAYKEYRLTRDEIDVTKWAFVHDKIITDDDIGESTGITSADTYKIVHVKNNNGKVALSWYGKNASGDFSIVGGDNITADSTTAEFDAKVVWGEQVAPAAGECYAIGAFSDWKVYDYFKMSANGVYAITDFHIYSGDEYKVIYDGTYRGLLQSGGSDGNLTATSSSVYFDAYGMIVDGKGSYHELGEEYFAPLPTDVVRITLFTANTDVKIWIWGKDEAGEDVDYSVGVDFYGRPSMTKVGSLNVWYFDIVRRSDFAEISGFLFTYGSTGNTGNITPVLEWGGYFNHTL